jgi:hypothetical protein
MACKDLACLRMQPARGERSGGAIIKMKYSAANRSSIASTQLVTQVMGILIGREERAKHNDPDDAGT